MYSEYCWCILGIHPIHQKYTCNSGVCVGREGTEAKPLNVTLLSDIYRVKCRPELHNVPALSFELFGASFLLNECFKWKNPAVFVFRIASAMTCFEKRLGALDAAEDSFQQKMINASKDIFALSLKLRYERNPCTAVLL